MEIWLVILIAVGSAIAGLVYRGQETREAEEHAGDVLVQLNEERRKLAQLRQVMADNERYLMEAYEQWQAEHPGAESEAPDKRSLVRWLLFRIVRLQTENMRLRRQMRRFQPPGE